MKREFMLRFRKIKLSLKEGRFQARMREMMEKAQDQQKQMENLKQQNKKK